MKKILIILLTVFLSLNGAQKKQAQDEIDHLALAALLFKDGHTQKAKDELDQVDLGQKNIDLVRYYTLKALIATKQEHYEEANVFFEQSLQAGQEDKSVYLYMAQNSFKLQKYTQVVEYIAHAKEIADEKPSLHALKAEALWRLEQYDQSLNTLKIAIKTFPNEYDFYRQRFHYYLLLELYSAALEDANSYLAHANPDEKTAIAFVSAFQKAKQTKNALLLAEELNLRYPYSATLSVLLAHLYIDNDMIQAAADLFDRASNKDAHYTAEAAEMLRRAKKFVTALYKNALLLDTKEKLKQRIAIYLEYGAFESIVVSRAALERSNLLEDENIRYALAYAYYTVGDFAACEKELKQLTRSDLFQKATELRKNIEKCQKDGWECDL